MEDIIYLLKESIGESLYESEKISINKGVHLSGGEPFLNLELLIDSIQIANRLKIPSLFVETNSSWAVDDNITKERLQRLRKAGLKGILVSVNPFLLEKVPFERIERVVRISEEIFGRNLIVYQEYFYYLFKKMNLRGRLDLNLYLKRSDFALFGFLELLPMGRAVYRLNEIFPKYPGEKFFKYSCKNSLLSPWHVHIDNYGNYITGFCGGISLANIEELKDSWEIDLNKRPIIKALLNSIKELYEIGLEFGYQKKVEGYISKCHLCVDIRKHLLKNNLDFIELSPKEFYQNL
jgi:hypothetical protein